MLKDSVRVAPSANLMQLQEFLGLHPAPTLIGLIPLYRHDVLFVAVDFEGTEHSGHGISQIGVSILDTRGRPYASIVGQNVIKSQLYCISKRPKNQRLDRKTKKIFTLGEVKWIRKQQLIDTLVTIFQECSSYSVLREDRFLPHMVPDPNVLKNLSSNQKPRNIVLVGHGLNNELKNMKILGFQPQSHANIIAQLDTEDLWDGFKGRIEFVKLKSLMRKLGLHPRNIYAAGANPKRRPFHNAGNDAAYTIEALLFLAVKEHEVDVDALNAGWIGLTRLSATEAITLASSLASSRSSQKSQVADLQSLIDLQYYASPSNDPLQHSADEAMIESKGTGLISRAFLLAAARWQLLSVIGNNETPVGTKVSEFDEQAQLIVGPEEYQKAVCAMPLYYALAPPWRLHSDRF